MISQPTKRKAPESFMPSSDGLLKRSLPKKIQTTVPTIPKTDTGGLKKFMKWRSTVKDKRLT